MQKMGTRKVIKWKTNDLKGKIYEVIWKQEEPIFLVFRIENGKFFLKYIEEQEVLESFYLKSIEDYDYEDSLPTYFDSYRIMDNRLILTVEECINRFPNEEDVISPPVFQNRIFVSDFEGNCYLAVTGEIKNTKHFPLVVKKRSYVKDRRIEYLDLYNEEGELLSMCSGYHEIIHQCKNVIARYKDLKYDDMVKVIGNIYDLQGQENLDKAVSVYENSSNYAHRTEPLKAIADDLRYDPEITFTEGLDEIISIDKLQQVQDRYQIVLDIPRDLERRYYIQNIKYTCDSDLEYNRNTIVTVLDTETLETFEALFHATLGMLTCHPYEEIKPIGTGIFEGNCFQLTLKNKYYFFSTYPTSCWNFDTPEVLGEGFDSEIVSGVGSDYFVVDEKYMIPDEKELFSDKAEGHFKKYQETYQCFNTGNEIVIILYEEGEEK